MVETSAQVCDVRLPRGPNRLTVFVNVPAWGSCNLVRRLPSLLSSINSLRADFSPWIMLLHQYRCISRVSAQKSSTNSALTRRACSYAFATPYTSSTRSWHASRATLPKWHSFAQHRGAKTKATLNLDDVPQGMIKSESLPDQNDGEPDYPPLLQQVRNNMLKFSHCVVVTRVGGFYEV